MVHDMKIMITGGAGFIGSSVVRHIIRTTNHQVVNVDKLTYAGNKESLAGVISSNRHFFEKVDICDRSEIRRVFDHYQVDAVMHLAAESHVDRSIEKPEAFIETNILGTYNLLQASLSYWKELDEKRKGSFRFHHVSTDEVYGDLEHSDEPFTEETPYSPSSPYSASKASSDHLVRAWMITYGLPIIITNCSNNYGPYHFPEKMIPHMILSALQGKPLPVYGDGQQIRDWLFVEDHARALLQVLIDGKIGETYNIGGKSEKKNLDVVLAICDVLENIALSRKPTNVKRYHDLITFVKDRPGHDRRYAINCSKIERELGWQPNETFETGLYKTVEWFLNNESWWQNVLSGNYKLQRIGA